MAYAVLRVVEATCRESPGVVGFMSLFNNVFVCVQCVILSAIPNGISARLIGASPIRRSVLGYTQDAAPLVFPIRGCLEDVRAMMNGDCYIGRGWRQRGLARSPFCNNDRVAKFGRQAAIELFRETFDDHPSTHGSALDALRMSIIMPLSRGSGLSRRRNYPPFQDTISCGS